MAKLVISGVIDGPLSGGLPKAVELTVLQDIADLSIFGIGGANNGGGSDGEEFTLSGSASAGDRIYVSNSSGSDFQSFFGFAPDFQGTSAVSINGDDAIELFENGAVIDTFGDINTDGSGQPWEYTDGWAYRVSGTGPDGTSFVPANWTFSGRDALDGAASNAAAGAAAFPVGSYTAGPAQALVINEVLGSTVSTDVEYIELFGTPGEALAGLSLIVVESDDIPENGTIDSRFDFAADAVIGDNGFYLVGNDLVEGTYGATPNADIPRNFVENSSYTIALVETATLDAGGTVTGGETVIDAVGVTDGDAGDSFAFGAPVVGPDGSFLPGGVIRTTDGVDTDSASDFDQASFFNDSPPNSPTAGTFGDIPDDDDPVDPVDPAADVKIHEVQGPGASSPLEGQTVTIEAIVTGDFQDASGADGDLNGFFVMEEDADQDADAGTSEGIFVFDGSSPAVDVTKGDLVRITGTVAEFFGETQISAPTVTVVSSNNALPTAATVAFPVAQTVTNSDGGLIADLEAYEGMLVTIPQELTVSDLFTLGRFGDIGLHADGRLETFTQSNAPDAAGFAAYQDLAVRNTVMLDDGSTVQNPATIPFEIPADGGNIPGQFDAADDLNVGDTVEGLTGVLRYSRGSGGSGDELHRLLPTDVVPFENTNPREDTAPDVGGALTVSTFNVLNFFTTLDDGSGTSGPFGAGPRGAENLQEFDRQLDKLLAAFGGLGADIYGLVEIENEFGDQNGDGAFALEFLTDAINAEFGTNYEFVDPGVPFVGGDAIATGFIYNANKVKVADGTTVEILDDSVLPSLGLNFGNPVFNGPGTSRAPIAVTFEELSSGETFTATTNHFKSKGSVSPFGNNAGTDDGAGNNNEARTQASIALDAWLDTDPTGSGDSDFLILGDLNAYGQEDPIQTLLGEGYSDLIADNLAPGEFNYSFGFPLSLDTSPQVQGFGSLDYALGSASLTGQVTGAAKWHINADEASALDYNTNFKPAEQIAELYGATPYRSSDHDPLIVGLDLGGAPAPQPWTLELLHIADQEGTSSSIVNAPNLSAVMNALEAQDLGNDGVADNTVRLSSGDAIIPGVFYDASIDAFGAGGVADILIQNELGLEAIALGNHEFDKGTLELARLIDGSAGEYDRDGNLVAEAVDQNGNDFTGTAFPYLSTNLDFSADGNMAPLEVAGGQAPQAGTVTSSTVLDVNGEALGVVGATTPSLPFISSPGTLGVSPSPFDANPTPAQLDALAAEIQTEVDALLADNPGLNKVVLLSHMQRIEIEQELAARLTDVDVIVAGGSNTRLFDDNDRPRDGDSDQGQYPIFIENAGGTQTAVVNTDGTYKYVGRLVVDFDENGHVIADSYDADVSGAYATDAQGLEDLGATGLIDPEIQAIADQIESVIIAKEGNVFGVSDVFLNGNRSGTFTPDDPDGVRTQETNLGNLTADANLAIARTFDDTVTVSIKNGGGIRANIGETIVPAGGTEAVRSPNQELRDGDGNIVKPAGGISQNDIAATLAFNNGLTLLTLSFAELKATLENGVDSLPGVSGGFLQVSGVQFSFDETRDPGDRIVNAAIVDADGNDLAVVVRDGVVQTPDQEVRIVTLNFLANGGDQTFDGLANPNRVDLLDLDGDGNDDNSFTGVGTFAADGSEQDALAEYMAANFGGSASAFDMADTGPDRDARIQNLAFRDDAVIDTDGFDFVFTGSNGGNDRFTDTAGNDLIETDGGRRDIFTLTNGGDDVIRIGDHVFDNARERITVTADQTFVLEVPELVEFEVYQRGSTTYVAFEPDNRFGDLVQIRGDGVTADTLQIETYNTLPDLDIA